MAITNKVSVGDSSEATHPDALKAALAEFIGTFIFVFVGLGSAASYFKTVGVIDVDVPGLILIAAAHGLAIVYVVSATANISGGHINPAVTFGLVIGGNITVLRGALYWVAQIVGAILASIVLEFLIITKDEVLAVHALGAGVSWIGGLIMEIILTFALVFVVYATAVDPAKGSIGIIAPIAIGFTVFANILVGASYSGASMNPARSFGPAVATLDFSSQWIYWIGPLIGGGLAGIVYDGFFLTPESGHNEGHTPLRGSDH